jgi:hypothetical protein
VQCARKGNAKGTTDYVKWQRKAIESDRNETGEEMYAEVASNECKPKTSQGRTL